MQFGAFGVAGHGLVLGDEAWGDGDRGTRSSPIVGSELATAACDYIALGHVHAFREVSTAMDGCGARAELGAEGSVDGPPAYYSGAPWGIGKAGVAVVTRGRRTGRTSARPPATSSRSAAAAIGRK